MKNLKNNKKKGIKNMIKISLQGEVLHIIKLIVLQIEQLHKIIKNK